MFISAAKVRGLLYVSGGRESDEEHDEEEDETAHDAESLLHFLSGCPLLLRALLPAPSTRENEIPTAAAAAPRR